MAKQKHFISLKDFSGKELLDLIELGNYLKKKQKINEKFKPLDGKIMGMIFQKPSLRTRVSFEVGMLQLGGEVLYLAPSDISLGKRERTSDISIVLSRYVDIIMARLFDHKHMLELAEYADVPVINGLTDFSHPCQGMADFLTIYENKGTLKGQTLAFIGDGNNVANSLILGGAKLGMKLRFATPKGYEPKAEVIEMAKKDFEETGADILITNSVEEAATGADVLYTDVWTSMGQEDEVKKRHEAFKKYQINMNVLNMADKNAMVLHCLPAHYGEEITDDVVKDPRSFVFDQAENRLHAQKAVILYLLS